MVAWGSVHAGAIVLGAEDGEPWGVEAITHEPVFSVTLVRHERRVIGYPTPDMDVTMIQDVDTTPEARVFEMFAGAGVELELIAERWDE
jgi:hypothetical protein